MEYEVYAGGNIVLLDGDIVSSVLQNVRNILSTVKGTCPMYRDFGIDGSIVDMPMTRVPPIARAEIREQIERYEPRFQVTRVSFAQGDEPNKIIPTVRGKIHA